MTELRRHTPLIAHKANQSEDAATQAMDILLEHTTSIPNRAVTRHLEAARHIMESIDVNDIPIMAAALAVDNDGIWTDDRHFLRQMDMPVWTTSELLRRASN